ncbi:MAG: VOC family protein [Pseudomonadota bacterium]
MANIIGIGGVFIRARDRDALAAWYEKHLAIPDGTQGFWEASGGPMVFAAFESDSVYFPREQRVMINFRVDDLDGVKARLEEDGIEVIVDPAWDGDGSFGRFARIHDPEGNAIELWEPPEAE